MSNYLDEEAQIKKIKNYWQEYGNFMITLVLVVIVATLGSRWWQGRQLAQREQASVIFEQLLQEISSNGREISRYTHRLEQDYSGTIYAPLAKLFAAQQAVNTGDFANAARDLSEVIETTKAPMLRQLARNRLAKLLLQQQQYTQAELILEKIDDPSFGPIILELKGDIASANNKPRQARKFYQQANTALTQQGINHPLLNLKLANIAD